MNPHDEIYEIPKDLFDRLIAYENALAEGDAALRSASRGPEANIAPDCKRLHEYEDLLDLMEQV